jgi:hypothetical protein
VPRRKHNILVASLLRGSFRGIAARVEFCFTPPLIAGSFDGNGWRAFSNVVCFRHGQGCAGFDMKAARGRIKLAESVSAALLELHDLRCTESISGILRKAFADVHADEGTIWLLDEKQEALVPVWSSGPYGERFVGIHRQPLTAGLMSLICVTEQAICENAVYQNAQQDPTLDRRLGVLTCAMIAVPLRFRDAIHGGVSCVRLKPANASAPEPPPFSTADLALVTDAVREVERVIEDA